VSACKGGVKARCATPCYRCAAHRRRRAACRPASPCRQPLLIDMFSSPPRLISMALVVGGVTHDPIKARRQLEQARAASAIAVACRHCRRRHRRRRSRRSSLSSPLLPPTPPSLSLPPPSPPSPPLLPPPSLLQLLLPLPPQSPPPQPWMIVMFSSPPPPKNLQLTLSRRLHCEAKSGIMRQAGDDEKRLVLVWVQKESIGQVTAMVVACSSKNQNDCALEMNFRKSAMWSKQASELKDIL